MPVRNAGCCRTGCPPAPAWDTSDDRPRLLVAVDRSDAEFLIARVAARVPATGPLAITTAPDVLHAGTHTAVDLITILDDQYPNKPKGHQRIDLRRGPNGILYRLRTGCPWNQLPKQFGDDRTVHRHFQYCCQLRCIRGETRNANAEQRYPARC